MGVARSSFYAEPVGKPHDEEIVAEMRAIHPQGRTPDGGANLLDEPVRAGRITPDRLELALDLTSIAESLGLSSDRIEPSALAIAAPLTMRRRSAEARLVIGDFAPPEMDDVFLRNLARGLGWLERIKAGGSIETIAAAEGLSRSRALQIVDLAFLSPAMVKTVLSGRKPDELTLSRLGSAGVVADWRLQAEIASA